MNKTIPLSQRAFRFNKLALILMIYLINSSLFACYKVSNCKSACDFGDRNELIHQMQNGDFSAVDLLIKNNCSIGDDIIEGVTILHYACEQNNVALVKTILEKNINPDPKSSVRLHTKTPLYIAAVRGEPEIVKLLLDYGADPNNHDRGIIGYAGTLEIAEILFSRGAKINKVIKDGYFGGQLPIHNVSRSKNIDVARFLIEHGAKINAQDNDGKTPLHIAVSFVNYELIPLYLEHGADPCIRDKDGKTPIDIALEPIPTKVDPGYIARMKKTRDIITNDSLSERCAPPKGARPRQKKQSTRTKH